MFLLTSSKHQYGFTLIELVVVIIIIGVLSVTVLPKFFNSKGFEEYAYRSEIVTKLRSIQLRAMQQSAANALCVGVSSNGKNFGVPTSFNSNCTGGVSFDSNYGSSLNSTLEIAVNAKHDVTIAFANGSSPFGFDKWGRPITGCLGGCVININGSDTLQVRIESEGYIHAL